MYREVGLMQVVEILRRWQAGDSARVIARGMGLARDTVRKYLREAERLGITVHGPAPTNEQIVALLRLSRTAPRTGCKTMSSSSLGSRSCSASRASRSRT